MRVSVIMPCYNQAEFLEEALESIGEQSFRDFELITVDDGSTDETPEILREWSSLISHNLSHPKNMGTAEAINTGFLRARGEYSSWVSSDNVMADDWLEVLLGAMRPNIAASYSAFTYEEPGYTPRKLFKEYDPRMLISSVYCPIGPSFMIRSSVWRRVGPHRGKISHDYDHWLRIEEEAWNRGMDIVSVNRSLCRYRAHRDRATVKRRAEFDADHWQIEALKRRGITA